MIHPKMTFDSIYSQLAADAHAELGKLSIGDSLLKCPTSPAKPLVVVPDDTPLIIHFSKSLPALPSRLLQCSGSLATLKSHPSSMITVKAQSKKMFLDMTLAKSLLVSSPFLTSCPSCSGTSCSA